MAQTPRPPTGTEEDPAAQPSATENGRDAGQAATARLTISANLPPGETLRVVVTGSSQPEGDESQPPAQPAVLYSLTPPRAKTERGRTARRDKPERAFRPLGSAAASFSRLVRKPVSIPDNTLFAVSLLFYLATRLVGLLRFPVNFSAEETASNSMAAGLISNRLFDSAHRFLPFYFFQDDGTGYGLSVYLQAAGAALFGRSPWVIRGIGVLAGVLLAVGLAHWLRDGFKAARWWCAPLILAVIPGWFPFSRSALAAPLAAVLYLFTIKSYFEYRQGEPHRLYQTVLLLACTAWVSAYGLVLSLLTGLALLCVDFRLHRKHPTYSLKALGLGFLLTLPVLRTFLVPPRAGFGAWLSNQTFIFEPGSLVEKTGRFGYNLAALFNPAHWFTLAAQGAPESLTLPGYGWLGWVLLPLAAGGVFGAFRTLKKPAAFLLMLLSLLPLPAAALGRVIYPGGLVFLAPLALLAGLGVSTLAERLESRPRFSRTKLNSLVLFALGAVSLVILNDSVRHGAAWLAVKRTPPVPLQTVFQEAKAYSLRHPDQQIYVSANIDENPGVMQALYAPDTPNIIVSNLEGFFKDPSAVPENIVFLITADEYAAIADNLLYKGTQVVQSIPTRPGERGLFIVKPAYDPDFIPPEASGPPAAALVRADITVAGEAITVRHSELDMGSIESLFDGDENSLARTRVDNPLVIEIDFPRPHLMSGVRARVGAEPVRITVQVQSRGDAALRTFSKAGEIVPDFKWIELRFGDRLPVEHLRLEIFDSEAPAISNVHVWEMDWIP